MYKRQVYDIQFLIVPFHMIYCGKNRITVFLLHRKIVAHCVFRRDSATTFYQPAFIEQGFCECCFTGTIISQPVSYTHLDVYKRQAYSSLLLFHHICYKWKKCQMTGSLDSLCYTTLILQRSTCNATGQNLTLLIQEFLQEFGILIVNVDVYKRQV